MEGRPQSLREERARKRQREEDRVVDEDDS
jgi:hypothetical protein